MTKNKTFLLLKKKPCRANSNCVQCIATTTRGNQCKRCTCRGNLCWLHLQKQKDSKIKKAPGMGLGLFSTRARYPGKLNTDYIGDHLTGDEVDVKYPVEANDPPHYLLCNDGGTQCVDAQEATNGFARYINHNERDASVEFGVFRAGPPAQDESNQVHTKRGPVVCELRSAVYIYVNHTRGRISTTATRGRTLPRPPAAGYLPRPPAAGYLPRPPAAGYPPSTRGRISPPNNANTYLS